MGAPMSSHFEVTADQIRFAAHQGGVSEATVKKTILGLIPDDHGIVAALVDLGVNDRFLARLRAVPPAASASQEAE